MKNKISLKFKLVDIAVIVAVLCAAAAIFLFFLPKSSEKPLFAVVKQDGETVVSLPLTADTEYTVTGNFTNIIKIQNGKAFFYFSDCPTNDCVHSGSLEKSGDIAVCLPNSVSVEIVGGSSKIDAIAG